jgi:hypothetical protein
MILITSGNSKMRYDRYGVIFKYSDPLNAGINSMQKYLSKLIYINDADSRNTARNSNINYFNFKREVNILIVILIIIYKMQAKERIDYINEYSEKAFVLQLINCITALRLPFEITDNS